MQTLMRTGAAQPLLTIPQRHVHETRPGLSTSLQHNLRILPPRTRRAPRANRTNEKRSVVSHCPGRQQIRPRGRSSSVTSKSIPAVTELGQHSILRNERTKSNEHQRSLHRCLQADHQERFGKSKAGRWGSKTPGAQTKASRKRGSSRS